MAQKTLAMRLLEGKKVSYQVHTYPGRERDAMVVARHLGVPAGQVFKTLVVTRERGKPILVMIPADSQLDLKRLAKELGEKKVQMASHQEAEQLTRLQVGGISPLALLNKGFQITIDVAARQYESIYISAGEKGINLQVGVVDLLRITGARVIQATLVAG
jgi:Cys-tRNA(Pro)/Cys-tRNA(Cys) deacylase